MVNSWQLFLVVQISNKHAAWQRSLEVGMNNLGSLQSQICFVKRVSSNALSVFGVETLQTKVAQYTLPLLHCITPCYTTSVYHCYTALHHVTQHQFTSATMCYTTLHHVTRYTLPLLQCVTLHYTMLHNILHLCYNVLHYITPCCTILTP